MTAEEDEFQVYNYELQSEDTRDSLESYYKSTDSKRGSIKLSILMSDSLSTYASSSNFDSLLELAHMFGLSSEDVINRVRGFNKNKLMLKHLKALDFIIREMELNVERDVPEGCNDTWMCLRIGEAGPILGTIFTYHDPEYLWPREADGRALIMEVDDGDGNYIQTDFADKTFVIMQGINSNLDLIILKMLYSSEVTFPLINDYLPEAVIEYAREEGAGMVFVIPIGMQEDALIRRGFRHYHTGTTDGYIEIPRGCFVGNEWDNMTLGGNETLVYML